MTPAPTEPLTRFTARRTSVAPPGCRVMVAAAGWR